MLNWSDRRDWDADDPLVRLYRGCAVRPPVLIALRRERRPLVFVCGPAVVAVTLTLTVQEPLAGMVPPVGEPNVRFVAAAAGAQVGPPVQVVLAAGVAAT